MVELVKIQIFTDASLSTQTHNAGFAFWTSCYQFEIQQAGYCGTFKSIAPAELHCIDLAVQDLLARDIIPVESIVVSTDSTEAIHKITNAKHPAFYNMIEFTIKNGMRPHQVFNLFSMKHIQAHTRYSGSTFHKNRWCDLMAKHYRESKTSFRATIFDNSDILL
jgi:hypothetical protein